MQLNAYLEVETLTVKTYIVSIKSGPALGHVICYRSSLDSNIFKAPEEENMLVPDRTRVNPDTELARILEAL